LSQLRQQWSTLWTRAAATHNHLYNRALLPPTAPDSEPELPKGVLKKIKEDVKGEVRRWGKAIGDHSHVYDAVARSADLHRVPSLLRSLVPSRLQD